MDPSNQHLLGGARRAPMNQDEFDTKFNFLNECRTSSRRRYTLDSIVEQPQAVASDLCGGALNYWKRAAQRSISIVARPPQLASQQQQILNQLKPSCQHKHISLASGNSGSGGPSNLPVPRYQLSNADDEAHLRDSGFYLLTHFPLIRILQGYSFRKDLFGDFRAGLALALHSTAEGLAMAFLAGLPPIFGLYSTFCASFLYLIFGTSHYNFMGTNLLICFLIRNIIDRNSFASSSNEFIEDGTEHQFYGTNLEPIDIAVTTTFLCAIIQASIYLFRLDFLFGFISEQIQGGFAMGVGLRIIFSQLENVIQLKSDRICASELSLKEASLAIAHNTVPTSTSSFPCIIWTYYRRLNSQKRSGTGLAVAQSQSLQNFSLSILANGSAIHRNNLAKSNPAGSMGNSCLPSIWECFDAVNLNTLAISISCILLLIFTRQIIGPLARFRLRSAVSSEFLLIILASLLSRILDVENRWHLEIVKFPATNSPFLVTFPKLSLTGQLFSDSLVLAFFVYSLHLRTANSLSRKHKYKIDERQEFLSMSLINILGSFFGALPPGQSPLRISIGIRAGAKTMLANIWLILSLIPLILWTPQLFNALPVSVLSCILLTQIRPLFAGISRLPILWSVSRLDVLTFCFTLFMALFSSNLCQTFFGSIIFAAGTTLLRAHFFQLQHLVNVTGSGAYYAERCFYGSDLMDESGAPILYHNVRYFKTCVRESATRIKGQLLGIGIGTRTGSMKSMKSTNAQVIAGSIHNKDSIQMRSTLLISGDFVPNYDNLIAGTAAEQGSINKVLILDFSTVPYIDAQAISIMRELFEDLAEKKCRLLFASVNSTIRTWFKLSGGFEHVPKHYFFPSVHDAVLCAQQMGGVIAPNIHMSVSLNGCRDLITLSNNASNHDLNLQSDTVNAQTAGGITLAPNSECASTNLGPFSQPPISNNTPIRPISSPIGQQNERETTSNVSTPATIKPFSATAMKKMPLKKSNS